MKGSVFIKIRRRGPDYSISVPYDSHTLQRVITRVMSCSRSFVLHLFLHSNISFGPRIGISELNRRNKHSIACIDYLYAAVILYVRCCYTTGYYVHTSNGETRRDEENGNRISPYMDELKKQENRKVLRTFEFQREQMRSIIKSDTYG